MARPFTCFANIRFFITPNMLDDGHDTTVNYAANWTRSFLTPLLTNPNFNNRTLIVVTFDENEVNPMVPCANGDLHNQKQCLDPPPRQCRPPKSLESDGLNVLYPLFPVSYSPGISPKTPRRYVLTLEKKGELAAL